MPHTAQTQLAERLAHIALSCVRRQTPHVLEVAAAGLAGVLDVKAMHPAFYGCFDWHSAVHTHWALTRLMRCFPEASFAEDVVALLDEHLTPERVAGELRFFQASGRSRFELPYGLAWLLTLDMELGELDLAATPAWREAIGPLRELATERLTRWLVRLPLPIRSGQHDQSALAMGLALDWADHCNATTFAELLRSRARELYGQDHRAAPLFEPSAHDFVSPLLAEADLMRRVLAPSTWVEWLEQLLPCLDTAVAGVWLTPVRSTDRSDGKLAHFCGLNLSRAWMLEAMVDGLPALHRWRPLLGRAAEAHRAQGFGDALAEEYAASHWLPSFATYLLTGRGLGRRPQEDAWPTLS